MNITYGRMQSAQKVVIYGPEGIGKSTFASRFPEPIFIDTEGSTKNLDVARLPAPNSWQDIFSEVDYVLQHPECGKTLVIDTADWAEKLCAAEVCRRAKKSGIEDFGYGKGYTYLEEEFRKLMLQLDRVIEAGIHVVITAHAKMRKFEQPDEMGAYDRWELKLTKQVAPIVKEWADMVLFANYKTYIIKSETNKSKAQGGERRMFTEHHPCWDAKNRHGLEGELPFTYESIRAVIETEAPKQQEQAKPTAQIISQPTPQVSFEQLKSMESEPAADRSLAPPEQREADVPQGIPEALAKLMREHHVDACEIQMVVYDKGYYPLDTPITAYDPGFVDAVLVGAWDQVYTCIEKDRKNFPF